MIIVEVNGQEVEFPDGTPPDVIQRVMSENFPPQEKVAPQGAGAASVYGFNTAVPFGGKITSALGAGMAKAMGAEQPFGELYDEAQALGRATMEESPVASGAGSVAGIAGTLPLAFTKPAQAVGSFVRGDPAARGAMALGGKALRGAAVSAPVGALYGAGEADDMAEGALQGGAISGAIGGGLPVVGAGVRKLAGGVGTMYKGATARGADALEGAADAIKKSSSKQYQRMRDIGATFKPQAKADIMQKINKSLASDGPLNKGLHGNTISVLDDLQKAAQSPDFGLEEIDQYRRLLSRIPRTNSEDVRKASIAIEALDNAVLDLSDKSLTKGGTEAVEALFNARKEYTRFSKFDRISEIIQKSGGDANKIKAGLQRFVDNKKKTRGFSKQEIEALREAARNTTGEGLLKLAGKFGIDLGSSLSVGNAGLPALFGAGSLATGSGGTGAAVVAGGTAARQGQKWLARGKAEAILQMIERGEKVPMKQIANLPPSDARKMMDFLGVVGTGRIAAEGAQ